MRYGKYKLVTITISTQVIERITLPHSWTRFIGVRWEGSCLMVDTLQLDEAPKETTAYEFHIKKMGGLIYEEVQYIGTVNDLYVFVRKL